MIKLIASDIDETIISKDQKVPERNKKAIKQAIEKGLIVMLATGRGPYEIFDIPEQAGVIADDRYIICCNGAVIFTISVWSRLAFFCPAFVCFLVCCCEYMLS